MISCGVAEVVTGIVNKVGCIGLCTVHNFVVRETESGDCSITFFLECNNIAGKYLVEIFNYLDSIFKEWWVGVDNDGFIISGVVGCGGK